MLYADVAISQHRPYPYLFNCDVGARQILACPPSLRYLFSVSLFGRIIRKLSTYSRMQETPVWFSFSRRSRIMRSIFLLSLLAPPTPQIYILRLRVKRLKYPRSVLLSELRVKGATRVKSKRDTNCIRVEEGSRWRDDISCSRRCTKFAINLTILFVPSTSVSIYSQQLLSLLLHAYQYFNFAYAVSIDSQPLSSRIR